MMRENGIFHDKDGLVPEGKTFDSCSFCAINLLGL